jgi:hypothetical protein
MTRHVMLECVATEECEFESNGRCTAGFEYCKNGRVPDVPSGCLAVVLEERIEVPLLETMSMATISTKDVRRHWAQEHGYLVVEDAV